MLINGAASCIVIYKTGSSLTTNKLGLNLDASNTVRFQKVAPPPIVKGIVKFDTLRVDSGRMEWMDGIGVQNNLYS